MASRPGALFTKIACPENRNGINMQYIDILKKKYTGKRVKMQ